MTDLEDHKGKLLQHREALVLQALSAAHDLNNMLHVVQSHADILALDAERPEADLRSLKEIAQACDRGAEIVRRLVACARDYDVAPLVDVSGLVQETEPLLRGLLAPSTTFTMRLGSRLLVRGEIHQVRQVLIGLVIAVRDTLPEGGGVLTLDVDDSELEESLSWAGGAISPGHYVALAVRGIVKGADAASLPPLLASDSADHLGLAILADVVDKAGGALHMRRVPGVGGSSRVLFPVAGSGKSP